jgi:hypothetical protein
MYRGVVILRFKTFGGMRDINGGWVCASLS